LQTTWHLETISLSFCLPDEFQNYKLVENPNNSRIKANPVTEKLRD